MDQGFTVPLKQVQVWQDFGDAALMEANAHIHNERSRLRHAIKGRKYVHTDGKEYEVANVSFSKKELQLKNINLKSSDAGTSMITVKVSNAKLSQLLKQTTR